MIDSTRGAARELIGLDEYNKQLANGTLLIDDRRRRPLWFDGRFLDAAALKSEQNYILGRQADIAKVAGVGVVHGLSVERLESGARTVKIGSGHGITPSGGLVMITRELKVDLADIPVIEKLDASFGLSKLAKQSAINRSGLFILALRPVEFTGHPIASYPTSINDARTVEDGQIIEATAITLIPYLDQGSRVEMKQRRKHVAREIFIEGSTKGQPTGVLPLAMIALNLGVIQWLDVFMVRRDAAALDHDVFGLGLSPRALNESYLQQYYSQLFEVLEQNSAGNKNVTAADHFAALPAAGPMPAASINLNDFSQSYFPAEMEVDISIIPDDELPALIEDSYVLPALDLTLTAEQFESTSILVVIPVPRGKLRQLSLSLKSLQRPLSTSAPGIVAKRRPITALMELNYRRAKQTTNSIPDADGNSWRQTVQGIETLWYIRRRNINYKEQVVADALLINREEDVIESNISNRLKELGLSTTMANIKRRGTTSAEAEIINLFSSKVMIKDSGIALKAALDEINNLEKVDRASVLKVSERFTATNFGEGISKLEKAEPSLSSNKKKLNILTASGKLPELDYLATSLTPKEFDSFSKQLTDEASGSSASSVKVASLIEEKLKSLDQRSTTIASRKRADALGLVTGSNLTTTVSKP